MKELVRAYYNLFSPQDTIFVKNYEVFHELNHQNSKKNLSEINNSITNFSTLFKDESGTKHVLN